MIPIFHSLFAWKESCVPARVDGSSYIPCLQPLVGGRGTAKWWRGAPLGAVGIGIGIGWCFPVFP